MPDYRVNLEIYDGPLDLLLYLIRRDEIDIYDIPIADITEQYVNHIDVIKALDPNLAGEFLVMAATLIEIKSRMLLPSPPVEEGGQDALQLDPRAELVRQLLEYKNFKDAAGDLAEARDERSQRFGRAKPADLPANSEVNLEDVQVWDLVDAFSNLMEAVGADQKLHEVIYDDTPIELHAADIVDRLTGEGSLTFTKIFEGRTNRSEIVGLFLAMLELIRRKTVLARQGDNFQEIYVELNPDPPTEEKLKTES